MLKNIADNIKNIYKVYATYILYIISSLLQQYL